jgi:hypothetical protein
MRARTLTLAAAAVLAAGGSLAVTLSPASAAAAGCKVAYKVTSQWQGGFQGDVSLTNLGDSLGSWTLGFDFPDPGQKETQAWNATLSQSGSHVTATNATWNGALATNASTSFGFLGTFTGSNPVPTSFTLNGVTCTGSVVTPTSSPTSSPTSTPPSTPTSTPPTGTPTGPAPALHVSGNKLLTAAGAAHTLYGVNRSGGEFACIQGNGFWDGPMDQASIDAMRTWKIRTVRVPLNEECWLGTADVPAAYGGTAYQNAVKAYVNLLVQNGITPIVEMHWNYGLYTGNSSGCSDVKATCQKPMPDAQYGPSFWTGVATAFKGNDAVVFDLFNEPYPERATGDETSGWKCWRDGGTCAGITYQVAGFQTLVNSVRATGASNVILIGGLAYSNDLTQWLTYKPSDPLNNLAAFAHVYNFNTCANQSCWDSQFLPVAQSVPLTLTEIGENDCAHGFVDSLMNWADSHGVGYLGWTWNTWDCSTGPSLISNFDGTATAYGQGLKARLATVSN